MSTSRGGRFGRFLPLLIVLVAGCDWQLPGKPDPAKRPKTPDHEMDFDKLFDRNCAGCHGKDGKAGPAPPLNDNLFRASIPEKELRGVITKGRNVSKDRKTLMPGFGKDSGGMLSPEQIDVLVDGIKGKKPAWGEWKPLLPFLAVGAPRYTVAQPLEATDYERIRTTVFKRACAGCHGADGKGTEMGGQKIGAINDPAFLALISNQSLRRIMITGRPDLDPKMPGYSPAYGRAAGFTPLTGTEIQELVALLAHWRDSVAVGSRQR